MPENKIPPITTIKCPVCHKGDIPLPLDSDGCQYCRHCGASYDTIHQYLMAYWTLLKWIIFCAIGIIIYCMLS